MLPDCPGIWCGRHVAIHRPARHDWTTRASVVRRLVSAGWSARALWQRVDREITDASPEVPLIASKDVNFLSKRVGNYQYSPEMGMLIDQLWVR